ncbi:oligosaccharide flippase family protein [Dyadobacter sp. CY261]|uniref:oligosaccharide flippase family protein n=1 Tax=Dyadobacter sp. CY261 TaxID=2907203 RepID=UPI001F30EAD6|nr:oligosaccharide flippase family protein [Dyadobacter sp. CY261]MCF0074490.1 oligosaccharide flippase family protein [Dyadobacter sp. CY261]
MLKSYQGLISKLKTHKTIISSFGYLSILQVLNMVMPLVSYPYLIRVLGTESYGLIIYITTIASYFSILVNFGYQLTATKKVAQNRHRIAKLNQIVSAVIISKVFLLLISAVIFAGMIAAFDVLSSNKMLAIMCFAVCVNEVIFPSWFFQGMEKMKHITVINVVSRIASLGLIFLFVKSPGDYLLVPIFNFLGAFGGAAYGWYNMTQRYSIRLLVQPYRRIRHYLLESWPVFATTITGIVKDRTNVIFIGAFLGNKEVLYYYFANRIVTTLLALFYNVSAAIFPNLSKSRNHLLLNKAVKMTALAGIFVALSIVVLSKFIVTVYGGKEMIPSIPILQILSVMLIIVPLTSLFGLPLVINGKYDLLYRGSLYSTSVYLITICVLYVMECINIYSVTFGLIFILMFELANRYYLCRKSGYGHWIFSK